MKARDGRELKPASAYTASVFYKGKAVFTGPAEGLRLAWDKPAAGDAPAETTIGYTFSPAATRLAVTLDGADALGGGLLEVTNPTGPNATVWFGISFAGGQRREMVVVTPRAPIRIAPQVYQRVKRGLELGDRVTVSVYTADPRWMLVHAVGDQPIEGFMPSYAVYPSRRSLTCGAIWPDARGEKGSSWGAPDG